MTNQPLILHEAEKNELRQAIMERVAKLHEIGTGDKSKYVECQRKIELLWNVNEKV